MWEPFSDAALQLVTAYGSGPPAAIAASFERLTDASRALAEQLERGCITEVQR